MIIGRCSRIEVKEHLKTCLQLSGLQSPISQDFEFIVDFVISNFGNYKLKELGMAFQLYAANRLEVSQHIFFNPRFIGEVMTAYKPIAVQVRQKTYVEPPPIKLPKLEDDEVVEELYQYWKESVRKDWRLLNIMAFDILWKRKELNKENISQDKAEKIKAKVIAFYKVNAKSDEDLERLSNELFIKNQCKRYILYLFLQNQL